MNTNKLRMFIGVILMTLPYSVVAFTACQNVNSGSYNSTQGNFKTYYLNIDDQPIKFETVNNLVQLYGFYGNGNCGFLPVSLKPIRSYVYPLMLVMAMMFIAIKQDRREDETKQEASFG